MPTVWELTAEGFVPVRVQVAEHSAAGGDRSAANGDFRIVAFRDGARPSHALIAVAGVRVRVNGPVIIGGLCVLEHRDELRIGSQQMFFSAESVPILEIYQHGDSGRRPRCPVCRAEIRDGQSVVRCPGCSRLHHQVDAADASPGMPCWTYSPACRFCEHPTSMSGEPAWRPDEEQFS